MILPGKSYSTELSDRILHAKIMQHTHSDIFLLQGDVRYASYAKGLLENYFEVARRGI